MPGRVVIIGLCGLSVAGCLGYPGPQSVENEDPAVKIPAIRRAVESKDRSIIPQLVKDLDSDDAAIRFAAINGLERLTGQTFEFNWIDEDAARRFPAVKRWNNYVAGRPLDEGIEPTTIATTRPATTRSTTTHPATTSVSEGSTR